MTVVVGVVSAPPRPADDDFPESGPRKSAAFRLSDDACRISVSGETA